MQDETNSQSIDEEAKQETQEPILASTGRDQDQIREEQVPVEPEEQEEAQDEEVVTDDQVQEEVQEETPEENPKEEPENNRIRQFVEKLSQQQPTAAEQAEKELDYRNALEADEETVKTLEADRDQYGQSKYNEGLSEAQKIQFETRLELDAPKVMSKYKMLDPESSKFDPSVADALNTMYLQAVGYDQQTGTAKNTNLRYSEYIDGMIGLIDSAASAKAEESSKNIAKQAASTGLRPEGSAAKMNLNKAPSQMTTKELEAVIKQNMGSLKTR